MRSRVIPGSSPTIDRREPVSRLNSVLLPTFGRPHTAINGSARASARAVSAAICEASSSTSRQALESESSPSRSRPATFSDRGVSRPTIPSAGRLATPSADRPLAGFFLVVILPRSGRFCCSSFPPPVPARLAGFLAEPAPPASSVRIVFLRSRSGDFFVTREALSTAARLDEITFRFRGSTAPVVGATLGARPFFGRVLACRCFLPNRFLSSLCATESNSLPRTHSGGQAYYAIYSLSSLL